MKKINLLYFVLCVIITNSLADVFQTVPSSRAFSPQQACLLPLEQMRRDHGDLLKQAHHAAAEQHIAPAYQLGACLDCHISKDSQGKFLTADSNTHFCQSCHVFVGTKITCFSCHPAQ